MFIQHFTVTPSGCDCNHAWYGSVHYANVRLEARLGPNQLVTWTRRTPIMWISPVIQWHKSPWRPSLRPPNWYPLIWPSQCNSLGVDYPSMKKKRLSDLQVNCSGLTDETRYQDSGLGVGEIQQWLYERNIHVIQWTYRSMLLSYFEINLTINKTCWKQCRFNSSEALCVSE